MARTILLTLTLLCCSAWMVAQSTSSPDTAGGSTSSQSNTGQSTAGTSSNSSETTLQGCLSGSSGSYMLTDASGTQYQLQGDTSQLSSHVNSEVEVKGTSSEASAGSASSSGTPSSTAGSSAAGGSAHTFNVTKVKKVSSSCSSAK